MAAPDKQQEFFDWQDNFMAMVLLNLIPWAIDMAQWAKLQALQTTYLANYAVGKKGNKANRTPTQTKANADSTAAFHTNQFGLGNFIANNIAKNPNISDAERLSLGTTIYATTHSPIGKPATVPVNTYEPGNGHTEKAYYHQQPDTAGVSKRAKPKGAVAIIYAVFVSVLLPADSTGIPKYAVAPVDPEDFGRFVRGTRSPVSLIFTAAQANLVVSVASCWVTATGKQGDWSTIQTFRVP